MVAVSSPAKVLVTGANGYLAVWVVKKYLEAGYSVRGTVRSLSKSAFLTERFSNYGDKLELVVVEDITKDGAFDEVVKGIDVIAHTASPFHFKATNPDGEQFLSYRKVVFFNLRNGIHSDIIIPAVRGTTSILNSALKHGSNVKRFVLTSSGVAIRESTTVPRVFTESDWNKADVEAVKTKGSAAGPLAIYMASKTLAEKAAWEFIAAHKSEISWDLVAINPPYIFGASSSLSSPLFISHHR
jgi:nucleoside-diphosphate-sugar epimerase